MLTQYQHEACVRIIEQRRSLLVTQIRKGK